MNPIEIATAIALERPQIGMMLLRGGYVQPLALTIEFQFSTTAIDTDVPGTMAGTPGSTASALASLFFVTNMVHTLRRPNWMPGSVLKGQDDYYTSYRPYVDLDIQFNGPVGLPQAYAVEITSTPIENLCLQYNSGWVAPWVLYPNQAPTLSGRNRRTLQDAEIPYIICWTLNGKAINVADDIYR